MSNTPSLDNFIIRTGCIVNPDLVYLLLESPEIAEKDIPHTSIGVWQRNKDWIKASLEYDGISAAVCAGDSGGKRVVIVGSTGNFTAIDGGRATNGIIKKKEDALASVNFVHGSVLAVGILGRIYRMKDPSSWDVLTNELIKTNIESSCEYPAGGFLVCGWQGLVAHYHGVVAERLESGTNVILTCIICDDDGEIFACGQKGTIVHGKKNSLKPLWLDGITDDFWSITKFQGEIYVSSTVALYKLVDDETLELVKFDGEEIPISFYHLDTYEDSLMLSVGKKDAVIFDGKDWTRIL
ncbi:MAG: hypothetical protein V7677_18505 [Motiliproteus sp.]